MDGKKSQPQSADSKAEVVRMAKELRSKANRMTDDQREAAFRHGMQLIYGGNGGVPAKTRSA